MTPEVRDRIDQIRQGIVPEGYKKTKSGILPESWSVRTIAECLERVEHPVEVQANEMYTQIGIRSHGKGLFYKEPVTGDSLGNKSVFWIEPDCFILNIVFAWEQAVGKTTQAEAGMIGSHRFPMYRPINGSIDIDYLISYLLTKRGTDILEAASPGGAGRNRTLGQDRFMKSRIVLPPLDEQKKIAEILSTQDKAIELQGRKIEELKRFKKGCLEKMFPRKGQKVPEKRFPGFTDDWEQRKLGDLVQFSKGTGYSKGDLRESGTPIILYGRLYTQYETVIAEVDTFADPKAGSVYSRGGEVIVPASGETAEDISIASVVEKSGVLLGGDLNIITPPADLDAAFLAISISNGKPHEDMAKMAQGKSVVHLHNTDLEKIDLTFPCLDEQTQISGYFGAIDRLITLHQRKLDEMKKQKKALMQLLLTGIVKTKGEVR